MVSGLPNTNLRLGGVAIVLIWEVLWGTRLDNTVKGLVLSILKPCYADLPLRAVPTIIPCRIPSPLLPRFILWLRPQRQRSSSQEPICRRPHPLRLGPASQRSSAQALVRVLSRWCHHSFCCCGCCGGAEAAERDPRGRCELGPSERGR